jgi:probable phosphoglycerate mutase
MAKSNEIRVLLMRTGETEWCRMGRIAGSTDVPLSDAGREQVRDAILGLGSVRLSTVLCGPDEASQATASALAEASGAKVKVVEELGENPARPLGRLAQVGARRQVPHLRAAVEGRSGIDPGTGRRGLEEAADRISEGLSRHLAKTKADSGAVGVVLRPIAHGLIGCEWSGMPIRSLWSMMETGPSTQWRTLQRDTLQLGRERARAGT